MSAPVSGPTPDRILQTGLGFWGSKALLSAVELGLFTELADGPLDLASITARVGLHARGARDFLDALVALGFLERENGLYHNTPETALFLDRGKPSYVGGILEMANARLFEAWGSLREALRAGLPQNEARKLGGDSFEALYADPARLRQFLAAMSGVSIGALRAIASKFPWRNYGTVVDVGCAQGCGPVQFGMAHPHLRGEGFDLPQVQPLFEEYVANAGLSDRFSFRAGSFFTDPLPSADVIVMGHILHDWDLETKRMLLQKAFQALPEGGAIIVYEMLIDDDRRQNAMGLLMSLNMLVETPSGFDFTGADCRGWMQDAGFRDIRVEHLVGPDSMVVGLK